MPPVHPALTLAAAASLAAAPVAWFAAAYGFGMAARNPARDIGVLLLWSVAEEIVFRGAVQPALARVLPARGWATITAANALTSLLFALLHLWRHPLPVAVLVFPVSLLYGRLRELSGRVWPSALLHSLFNLLLYAASWLQTGA